MSSEAQLPVGDTQSNNTITNSQTTTAPNISPINPTNKNKTNKVLVVVLVIILLMVLCCCTIFFIFRSIFSENNVREIMDELSTQLQVTSQPLDNRINEKDEDNEYEEYNDSDSLLKDEEPSVNEVGEATLNVKVKDIEDPFIYWDSTVNTMLDELDYRLVSVQLGLTNNTTMNTTASPYLFKLKSSKGNVYFNELEYMHSLELNRFGDMIRPAEELDRWLTFRVPNDEQGLVLVYTDPADGVERNISVN